MSKTLKNIVSVFTLICVIIFLVFCMQLFMLNRNNDSEPNRVISNNNAQTSDDGLEPDDNHDINLNDGIGPLPNPNDDLFQPAAPITPPQNTTRQSFLLSPGVAELVYYVDLELFERIDQGESLLYKYTADGTAELEISFYFIHPQGGVNALADNFLSNYLDGAEEIIEAEQRIGQSQVRGVFVTGQSNDQTYSAWLRSLADLDVASMALVIFINYHTDLQRDMLYDILDTLHIGSVSSGNTTDGSTNASPDSNDDSNNDSNDD